MASVDPWTPDPKTGKPRHRARWRDPSGKPRAEVITGSKRTAKKYGEDQESAGRAGTYQDPSAGKITFQAYAETWLADQVFADSTRTTVAGRLGHAYSAFGARPLRSVTPSTLRAWIKGLGVADSTARQVISYVSAVFAAAVDDGRIQKNPFDARSVKRPTGRPDPVVPFSTTEVAALAGAIGERYRAIPILGTGCGLRQGEMFGLHATDIDFLGQWVHVNRQMRSGKFSPPKGGKKRRVPMPATVGFALAEHIRRFPVADGPMFRNEYGSLIRHTPFNEDVWKPALRAIGVDDTDRANGCHRCRHTFASALLADRESLANVAEYMGNTPAVVLRTYTHLMPDDQDRARKAMDAFLCPEQAEEDADPARFSRPPGAG